MIESPHHKFKNPSRSQNLRELFAVLITLVGLAVGGLSLFATDELAELDWYSLSVMLVAIVLGNFIVNTVVSERKTMIVCDKCKHSLYRMVQANQYLMQRDPSLSELKFCPFCGVNIEQHNSSCV